MSNFKPEVFVNGQWAGNSLVFATEREALDNARDLVRRWLLAMDARAVPTEAPVNYRWDQYEGLCAPLAVV